MHVINIFYIIFVSLFFNNIFFDIIFISLNLSLVDAF